MKSFEEMEYHPASEKLVGILRDRTQRDDSLFFRIMIAYYFSMAAAQMRCSIDSPNRGEVPVNMYALNLAPSGYGKTMSSNLLEEEVLLQFRTRFLEETFPIMADDNLPKIAVKRAARKGTDPEDELTRLKKEFESSGPMLFSFDSGTSPAVKQMRHKLLMANAGSMNLIMDEVSGNLTANQEVFTTFIELFDKGLTKQKLIKNSTDNARSEEIIGKTPANLLMFGVPTRLFDGAKIEDELMAMLDTGYARRCFFGYVRSSNKRKAMTPEEAYAAQTNHANDTIIQEMSDRLEILADIVNANKKLRISKDTSILLNTYQQNCEARAEQLPDHQEIQKSEIQNRFFKVLKLAGAYAFIDNSPEVTESHIYNAIKLAEDSGAAFSLMLSRDKPWVKLAKYIAAVGQDVTQADLAADLPFYKGGTGAKQEMLTMAMAYGYKNNIIIKKSFADGIEFLRGETLKATNLSEMVIAYSADMTTDYRNERAPFDKLHLLTQKGGLHWVAHHLMGGYRNEENAIPGFNIAVVDIDGGVNMSTAQLLLKNYKYLMYTTKRHTETEHRFRILLPLNYELKLDMRDYKEFMNNLFDWLPFEIKDRNTNQRARKWLSHEGTHAYNDGELLDALPFIPKTSKNEERKQLLNNQHSMDNLERWVINNIGDGNRNNMLHRYAMILIDGGFGFDGVRERVFALNEKIPDKLDQAELYATVLTTVSKELMKK